MPNDNPTSLEVTVQRILDKLDIMSAKLVDLEVHAKTTSKFLETEWPIMLAKSDKNSEKILDVEKQLLDEINELEKMVVKMETRFKVYGSIAVVLVPGIWKLASSIFGG